jgi:hypothetical protein
MTRRLVSLIYTRFGRAGEELHKCVLGPAQISNQPRRSFNEAGICRFGPIQVDTDKQPSDEEQRQGEEKLRCDDNYAKECGIRDLCFAWNCRLAKAYRGFFQPLL